MMTLNVASSGSPAIHGNYVEQVTLYDCQRVFQKAGSDPSISAISIYLGHWRIYDANGDVNFISEGGELLPSDVTTWSVGYDAGTLPGPVITVV